MTPQHSQDLIGVIAPDSADHAAELLGDARELANRIHGNVIALTFGDAETARQLIAHGADIVTAAPQGQTGPNHRLSVSQLWQQRCQPRLTFLGATGDDRALAAKLAARCGVRLISPVLSVAARNPQWNITALHADGRRARQISIDRTEPVIVTMRPGVAQSLVPDANRRGTVESLEIESQPETLRIVERLPADPATADIVHLPRLAAGGRGLGGPQGFELLRKVAQRLDAGIAASRMAVDLGWIERDRQVGQTGKTVRPDLYLAAGISGASHHREGMSDSRHIIALNRDAAAPIFQLAHLGLVADWRETLEEFVRLTQDKER
jgi:electron transfer flavoprotein alpha subunit